MRTNTAMAIACAALIVSGNAFAGSGSWSLRKATAPVETADTVQPQAVKGATGPEGTVGPAGPAAKPVPTRTTAMHR
jgi:hypothetical protein